MHCNTCGGEYDSVQRDGSTYFHVCPPQLLVRAELHDGRIEERPVEGWRGIELVPDAATRAELVAAGRLVTEIAIARSDRAAERADHRDENTLRREGVKGETRVVKSEGRGARQVAPGADAGRL